MKKSSLLFLCMVISISYCHAKCTNEIHLKGHGKENFKYECKIKGNERGVFKEKKCPFCGCLQDEHDNE